MTYQIFHGTPDAIAGEDIFQIQEAQNFGQPPACPPFTLAYDGNCPHTIFEHVIRRNDLCDRILGAIKLAENAAAKLEAKPLHPNTVAIFVKIFGQAPHNRWEVAWATRRTSPAGEIVARRFRTVAKELRTRDTAYRCVSASQCSQGGGGAGSQEPSHPTETIVRDRVAWAVLCKDEVRLCPQFWQLRKEERTSTVLHEMFHLCFGLTCAWFQHDGKERKRNSAYCYEAFALSVANISINTADCDNTPI